MRTRLFLSVCLFVFTSLVAATQVSEYTLKNGLTLLVKPDHRAPVAIFQIWYRVGGSYEPNGITGISHVLEHMLFEGTKKYPAGEFSKIVNANGGQLNAFTSNDYTGYYEQFSADKMPLSFKLEADRMQHATLSEASFKKEIQVVMEERRMRTDDVAASKLYERLRAAAFISSPYHHMTIGWMGDLKHMTVENVRAWYSAWYVPNNATIVVVGDVKPAEMYKLAKKYFAAIPRGELIKEKPAVNQAPLGERMVNVSLPAKVPVLYMAYNVPVIKTAKQAWEPYALDVLSTILGGSDSSVLSRDLVRQQKIAAAASAGYQSTSRLSNLFTVRAIPTKGHTIAQLKTAISKSIEQLQNEPVSEQVLTRVKNQVVADMTFSQDSITEQASMLGSFNSVGLPWKLIDSYSANIEKVTAQQVQAVAKQYLTQQRLTTGILHPLAVRKEAALAKTLKSTAGDIS